MKHRGTFARISALFILSSALSGCLGAGTTSEETGAPACATLTGSAWVPSITGVGTAKTATISQATQTVSGPVTGYAQAAGSGKELTATFTVTDLGVGGSLTLSANVTGASSSLMVYPLLVYLSDGTHDYVNLARAGAGGDCAASGYFTGSGNTNTSCTVSWPSAYVDRDHWQNTWLTSTAPVLPVINSFPTCNWSGGSTTPFTPYNSVACPFNSVPWFSSGKLPTGTYTAKYVLLSGSTPSVSGTNANLELTVVQKTKAATGGVVDLNVVFVGSSNVNASRTAKGQLNLNTLFQDIFDRYNAVGIKVGTLRAFEWPCDSGGDSYASITSSQITSLFAAGGAILPSSATASGSLNLFLINSFTDSASTLGIAGAINGTMTSATRQSGVAVATLGKIATYNPSCSGSSCPLTSQESAFAQLGPTVAHEMGHYLGLNHPSESDASLHDLVIDTPSCSAVSVTITNCKSATNSFQPTGTNCAAVCTAGDWTTSYCSAHAECQFNYLMFRTSKHFVEGVGPGEGNLISTESARIMSYHALVQ